MATKSPEHPGAAFVLPDLDSGLDLENAGLERAAFALPGLDDLNLDSGLDLDSNLDFDYLESTPPFSLSTFFPPITLPFGPFGHQPIHLPSAINLPSVSQPPFRPIVVVSQQQHTQLVGFLVVRHPGAALVLPDLDSSLEFDDLDLENASLLVVGLNREACPRNETSPWIAKNSRDRGTTNKTAAALTLTSTSFKWPGVSLLTSYYLEDKYLAGWLASQSHGLPRIDPLSHINNPSAYQRQDNRKALAVSPFKTLMDRSCCFARG